jgi:hypothetical protein
MKHTLSGFRFLKQGLTKRPRIVRRDPKRTPTVAPSIIIPFEEASSAIAGIARDWLAVAMAWFSLPEIYL